MPSVAFRELGTRSLLRCPECHRGHSLQMDGVVTIRGGTWLGAFNPLCTVRKLHFCMKSRLLPPPSEAEREFSDDAPLLDDAPSVEQARRATDEPVVAVKAETETKPAARPAVEPYEPSPRPAPQVSARPKGRLVVAAILLACVSSLGYSLWSTFLRNAAYGEVVGQVTEISTPWSGTLNAVYVRAGDSLRQGDVLAVVEDFELQAELDRLGDALRTAQAELDAQVALIALAAQDRGNAAEEIRAHYYDLRGVLLAERARYEELTSKLQRREELAGRKAYSSEEIESLRFVKSGLAAKIENLEQAVTALETRLESLPTDDGRTAQLKPQLAKIESTQAEMQRLREKQHRGTVRAPMNGKVVAVHGHVGERTTSAQPLLEFLPDDTVEMVLYVKQHEVTNYQVGQQAEVIVEPATEPIVCEITRIGHRYEQPKSYVVGRYRPDEKLLPVYLTPTRAASSATSLRIGSTVRLPASFFGN